MMRLAPALPALFAVLLAAAPAPSRAADPLAACRKATAKALSSCVGNASSAQVKCFQKTGIACPADDKKLVKALEGVGKSILGKCADATAVAEAGYAPLDPAGLVARFEDACTREIDDISARAFGGPDGDLLGAASQDDAKCLLAAGKEAGKLLASSLQLAGKCTGKACDARALGKNAEKQAKLEAGAAKAIDKKCADLEALVGKDTAGFVAEAALRAVSAASSPCDDLDPEYCIFPFPNDYFTVSDVGTPTGRRLAYTQDALPLGATPPQVRIDPAKWNVLDGFSVGPVLIVLEETVDLAQSGATPITEIEASLETDAPVALFDTVTGERQLLFVERDLRATVPAEQVTFTRVGANLVNGRRYIAAMSGMRDAAGDPLAPDPVFAALRDQTASGLLPVEARRAHMEDLFASLEGYGVDRAGLYLAWDFTTQSTESSSRKLLAMRDDAFAILGEGAPAFTVDSVTDNPNTGILRRIDGTFQVPLYLTQGGVPGSELRLGPDGLPVNQGDSFTASYRCIVPESATTGGSAPAIPARPSLYGHGLLGSANETSASHVRAFASEHNLIFCGTDWTGFSEEDEAYVGLVVLRDFAKFANFIERQHQGVLNFMVLGRLLLHPDGFASDEAFQIDGESLIDPSDLFYDGNSQGGILGGVLAAFSQDIERFVLGVPGINYSFLLDRSKDFDPFREILLQTYPGVVDRAVLIAFAQLLWDQTDPNGHVRHTLADPYPGTPAKKILYQVAFGDQQVAPVTVEIAARSNGASIHTPVLEPGRVVPETTPYFGIPAIPAYPFDGSAVVIWDSGNPAPPIGNLAPPELTPLDPEWALLSACPMNFDSDPHECPRRQPAARVQKSEFLKSTGAVVDVCSGMACLAPLP